MKKAKYFYLLRRGFLNGGGYISAPISKLFAAEGFTVLSQACANVLAEQIKDVRNIFYLYSVARAAFADSGFTELSTQCSLILMDQISA